MIMHVRLDATLEGLEERLQAIEARLAALETGALPDNDVDAGQQPHDVRAMWRGTQEDFDALVNPSETTLYIILPA